MSSPRCPIDCFRGISGADFAVWYGQVTVAGNFIDDVVRTILCQLVHGTRQ